MQDLWKQEEVLPTHPFLASERSDLVDAVLTLKGPPDTNCAIIHTHFPPCKEAQSIASNRKWLSFGVPILLTSIPF